MTYITYSSTYLISYPLSLLSFFILISIYLSSFDSLFIMLVHVNLTSYVVVITHKYLTFRA